MARTRLATTPPLRPHMDPRPRHFGSVLALHHTVRHALDDEHPLAARAEIPDPAATRRHADQLGEPFAGRRVAVERQQFRTVDYIRQSSRRLSYCIDRDTFPGTLRDIDWTAGLIDTPAMTWALRHAAVTQQHADLAVLRRLLDCAADAADTPLERFGSSTH